MAKPKRSLKLDLFALALLAAVVFLGVSLGTFDPGDAPGAVSAPARRAVQNACGPFGALAAHGMLALFGAGAYYLVLSGVVLDALLLCRRPIDQPLVRTF